MSKAASVANFGAKGDGVTDDTQAFANAIAAGGTVTVPKQSGRCYVLNGANPFAGSTVSLLLPPNVNLQGQNNPSLCSTNSQTGFILGATGNVKIDGLTFDGTGGLLMITTSSNHQVSGITFTNNKVMNLTSMTPQGAGLLEWGILTNSNISNNVFQNFWPGGYAANANNQAVLFPNNGPNGTPCYNSPDGSLCDVGISGMSIVGGLATTSITHNKFAQIANDAMNVNFRPDQLTTASHIDAKGVVIASNEFVQIHRMGIEMGGFGDCNGACDFSLAPLNAPVIKNNYFHNPTMPFWHTFGYSLVFNGSVNATIINNTSTNDNTSNCYGNAAGDGFEHAANSLIFQGNVVTSAWDACGSQHGWAGYVILGGIDTLIPQGNATYQNNVTCGQGASNGFSAETTSVPMVVQNNFQAESCPFGNSTASTGMTTTFTTPKNQTVSASGTWQVAVVSTLSIVNVQFFLDANTTPIATQELSSMNTGFASTRQWLYHTTLNTSTLSNGIHNIKAVVTDVSGAQQAVTQSFTVTGGTTSAAPIAPTPPTTPPVPGTPSNLPANLPKSMLVWLANDAGVVTKGSGVIQWTDSSGNGNSATQSQAANQPTLVNGDNGQNALHFDGKTSFLSIPNLPIEGLTGMTVFVVSANSTDNTNASAASACLYWPETAPWGVTYFSSFQTASRFRFGTTQANNDSSYTFGFPRTQTFGLSEWMHNGTTDSMWFNAQSVGSFSWKASGDCGRGDDCSAWARLSELVLLGRCFGSDCVQPGIKRGGAPDAGTISHDEISPLSTPASEGQGLSRKWERLCLFLFGALACGAPDDGQS